ncbi:MAG: D-alanine--D-alanine ligase [Candidatus Doudnabacteria bacterium Gr01-1014_77]|uniref:D-alanine--D-alanine ligase n=1 Tax=Candidatus Doudnabacteria bacterium Gr01-1014_77 TaxID=2017133 RepID=A0A554JDU0_9BACT|nr:MAG: D-alanine--D-alanine ligase [Candidatus Doudnabacteria bacterium Gr01-1014_77]
MKNIAVIFGGQSAEHEVSIITAHIPIIQSLEALGQFKVFPVYISKKGEWYCEEKFKEMSFFQEPDFEQQLLKFKKVNLSLNNHFKIIWPGITQKSENIDIVFPAMHGTNGEDGSLMGLLRFANVPFVGCDMASSAIAMDKAVTKQVLSAQNISVVPYVWFVKSQWEKNREKILDDIKKLNWPMFVKPVHLGSSIGISKVKNEQELLNAVEVALHYDNKVLVEESIEDLIEVTLPIIGNENPELGSVERPLNKTEFFDFKDKYLSAGKGQGVNAQYSQIPAEISQELSEKVKELGLQSYKGIGCSGIARIDFLINSKTGMVYVNEINTLPGSLYHHNWRKSGVSSVDLVKKLVVFAEQRFEEQKTLSFNFNSDILKKFKGAKG